MKEMRREHEKCNGQRMGRLQRFGEASVNKKRAIVGTLLGSRGRRKQVVMVERKILTHTSCMLRNQLSKVASRLSPGSQPSIGLCSRTGGGAAERDSEGKVLHTSNPKGEVAY
eukprot:c54056_g1_i1 orf=182-520(+)